MMKCLIVCLAGLLCVSSAVAEAEELARCKRIMCDMLCPFGRKTDHNGCELCDCKANPCMEMKCAAGQACVPHPEPHCQECPLLKCKDMGCQYGYAKDRFGCGTCTCKTTPCEGFRCKEGERCFTMRECDGNQNCDMKPQCVPDDHNEEPPNECAMPMCAASCQLGYKNDENGCMTCNCRESPCDTHRCPEGSECQAREQSCQSDPCPVLPICTVIPLCKRTKSEHKLECDGEGTFKPMQCHSPEGVLHKECWCVNDRGIETEGSRLKVLEDEKKPDCAYNRTVRIHVQFFLRHDFDKVEVHLGNIKTVVHHHITQWLLVDKEYIVQLKVEPHSQQAHLLVVEFEVVRQGRLDLAATAVQLKEHMMRGRCAVLYQGHKLDADPSSLHMQHTYGPDIVETPVHRFYNGRCHRVIFVLGCVGATVLLIGVVIMIIVVNRKRVQKRRRERFTECGDNFKQNIAFSNELYDQTCMLEGDIKKIKLEFTTEPVVEASINPVDA